MTYDSETRAPEYEYVLACHEAGHTVAAYLHRRRIKYVTIKPKEGEYEGIHMPGSTAANTARDLAFFFTLNADGLIVCGGRRSFQPKECIRKWVERETIICLAGYAAEEAVTLEDRNPVLTNDGQQAWKYCTAVCMDEVEAHAYFNYLHQRTRNIMGLHAHRKAVGNLAAELVKRKKVGGHRATEIIEAAIGKGVEEFVLAEYGPQEEE